MPITVEQETFEEENLYVIRSTKVFSMKFGQLFLHACMTVTAPIILYGIENDQESSLHV